MDELWHRSVDIHNASKAEKYVRRVRRAVLDRGAVLSPRATRGALLRTSGAVSGVIELHRPAAGAPHPMCPTCSVEFPCPTRRAITAAVLPPGTDRPPVSAAPVGTEPRCCPA